MVPWTLTIDAGWILKWSRGGYILYRPIMAHSQHLYGVRGIRIRIIMASRIRIRIKVEKAALWNRNYFLRFRFRLDSDF